MSNRGKKDCPNCKAELGARTILCKSCAYYFPTKEIRKDLLEVKIAPKSPKFYDTMGPGRKTCPSCKKIVIAIIKNCPECNFDFIALKNQKLAEKLKQQEEKEKNLVTKEDMSPLTKQILASIPSGTIYPGEYEKESSAEHAKRILSYGKERALNLLKLHKSTKDWGHVDWKMVEEELENKGL